MNIVQAYIKLNKGLLIFISGLSGCGRTTISRNISDDFNIPILYQIDYYKKDFKLEKKLSNNITIKVWDSDDAIDWDKMNKDINRLKKNGLIVNGAYLPTDKIKIKPDCHIHISIKKNICLDRRRDFITKHKDKYKKEFKLIGTDTERLKMSKITFPYYLEIMKRSKFDKFIDGNDLTDEQIYDKTFDYLIQFIEKNIYKNRQDLAKGDEGFKYKDVEHDEEFKKSESETYEKLKKELLKRKKKGENIEKLIKEVIDYDVSEEPPKKEVDTTSTDSDDNESTKSSDEESTKSSDEETTEESTKSSEETTEETTEESTKSSEEESENDDTESASKAEPDSDSESENSDDEKRDLLRPRRNRRVNRRNKKVVSQFKKEMPKRLQKTLKKIDKIKKNNPKPKDNVDAKKNPDTVEINKNDKPKVDEQKSLDTGIKINDEFSKTYEFNMPNDVHEESSNNINMQITTKPIEMEEVRHIKTDNNVDVEDGEYEYDEFEGYVPKDVDSSDIEEYEDLHKFAKIELDSKKYGFSQNINETFEPAYRNAIKEMGYES